jgi:hypothetical protein
MRPVKEQSERPQLQADVGPDLSRENHSNVCVLPMTLSPKVVLNILCAFYAVLTQVQNKASDKCIVSSDHPVRQRRLQLISTNINTHSVVMQRIKAAKQTGVLSEDSDTTAPSIIQAVT